MKITITVPQNNKKWKISSGGTPKSYAMWNSIYNRLRGLLSRLEVKEKVSILVKYGDGGFNETIASSNANYLLYTVACFIEDYVSPEVVKNMYKKYSKGMDYENSNRESAGEV